MFTVFQNEQTTFVQFSHPTNDIAICSCYFERALQRKFVFVPKTIRIALWKIETEAKLYIYRHINERFFSQVILQFLE